MRRLWVGSYDMADDSRRSRIDRLLSGLGDRAQESVFEIFLRADRIPAFRGDIEEIIDGGQDKVALVPLCRWCQDRVIVLGLGRRPEQPWHWIV